MCRISILTIHHKTRCIQHSRSRILHCAEQSLWPKSPLTRSFRFKCDVLALCGSPLLSP